LEGIFCFLVRESYVRSVGRYCFVCNNTAIPVQLEAYYYYCYYYYFKIYKTLTSPVVLYGGENWSVPLTEKHKLRVFENRVLRIFGPKRDKVRGKWRRLHNKKLYGLH
jgi:hypothetical protein